MEALIARQAEILEEIKRIHTNFKKDSGSRKTTEYLKAKLERLDELWVDAQRNDAELSKIEDQNHQYFTENIIEVLASWFKGARSAITLYNPVVETNSDNPNNGGSRTRFDSSTFGKREMKAIEIQQSQYANFRAFKRLTNEIRSDTLSEKWEIEDTLRSLESRWGAIDRLHLQIDGILEGADGKYYEEFGMNEREFQQLKRALNVKLNSSVHQQQSMPKIEIPTFSGNYNQWPTFMDLYSEAIHKNPSLSKAQKMQHLKGRLRGEAERIVQHLHVSAENYDTCWDLLTHRYNNRQLLFTKHIQILMRQPTVQKQSAFDLKRMYDNSMEAIHAIHNLGIDTTSWDPIIVHILCEKLDTDTYSDYMESRSEPRELPVFDEFMTFIEKKFTALEPLHKKKFENTERKEQKPQFNNSFFPHNKGPRQNYQQQNHKQVPYFRKFNAYYNVGYKKTICPICNSDHALFYCPTFRDMSAEAKLTAITKMKVCKNCLYQHNSEHCKSEKRCRECKASHHTLLHDLFSKKEDSVPPTPKPPINPPKSPKEVQNNFVSSDEEEVLLATALVKVRARDGEYITLRALIDQGSQVTLITENAAQRLGVRREQLHASISGVGTLSNKSRGKVELHCNSIYDDFQFNTEALVMTRVVNNLPNTSFEKKAWEHVSNITLADPDYNVSRPIDMLLDAQVYSEILMSGLIKGQGQQPIAQQTRLGWILSGSVKTYNCNVVTHNIEELAKYWEVEDINDQSQAALTSQEQYCEDNYVKTTRRLESGRYVVSLPMKENYEARLGTSKTQAIAQFRQLERKFEKDEKLSSSYKQFMREYLEMAHMKEAKVHKDPSCYLPHHGVIKQDSLTTKLRTVFNASMKTSSGYSLNDLMECGPKLHQDLQALLIGWRLYKYVFTADCEKMYRMILVREEDQKLQKIVWRETPDSPLTEYQLCTVTYGTKAAPYLALRTLKQLAQDDAKLYPLAADVINNQMYVDDVISGSNSLPQAQQTQQQLIQMFQGAGLNLRKWASNETSLLKHITTDSTAQNTLHITNEGAMKALGLQWNPETDDFAFKNKISTDTSIKHTKRSLLSEISKIFDPLGWLSPVTVKAKLLFQDVWTSGYQWDDTLPDTTQNEWKIFTRDLQKIEQVYIPRWVGDTDKRFQLHGFCDASEKAYACAIYVCTLNEKNDTVVRLIAAKSKLAPTSKKISLPRLELCGAVLLARLMKKILTAFKWEKIPEHSFTWTDSMVVLGWLQGEPSKWKSFVSNRVQQVTDIIPKQHWRHVKSEENAVDCATRGMTGSQLLNHQLWWQGPEWMTAFKDDTRPNTPVPSTECEAKQKHKQTCVTQRDPSTIILDLIDKHSSMSHITHTVAWIYRFINNARSQTPDSEPQRQKYLTTDELTNAVKVIVKQVQSYEFKDEIIKLRSKQQISLKSGILSLNPFIDSENVLRVGGRLANSTLNQEAKCPMLLPHNSMLTELIITQAHQQTLHGGPKLTLTHLRQKFWVVGGYRAVKRVVHKCIKCRRHNAINPTQIMADLPAPRVTVSRPFSHSGVDFTGHVEIKANKGRGIKTLTAYIAVFICLATKAIHLELVTDLSSTAFLAAFKRFCARRGKPQDMYSDNGTNFVGANRLLRQQYRDILSTIDTQFLSKISDMGINWHFNAPAWPSAGGLWESAVKSMKYHLKRVLGDQKLTYEEFSTLLCEIEACLNSRPLCPLTEDKDDINCLTPGHFLIGTPMMALSEAEQGTFDLRKRWQLVQKLSKDFWKIWSKEYLQQLQARLKWKKATRDTQIGDIVCIKDENLPAGRWALGRVLQLHPGRDGHTRVITLKTARGETKRPILKTVPLLDINEGDTESLSSEQSRRKTNKPSLKTLLCYSWLLFMTLVTPTVQQQAQYYETTTLTNNQSLYFDKLGKVQEVKDEWKLVIYYNMTSYWANVNMLDQYVYHLKRLGKEDGIIQFQLLLNQVQQNLHELDYYNQLLAPTHKTQEKRFRRGLINGIGMLANELFGVLDERFAERYEKDITTIQHNEKHLLNLIKNQTSILEAENNIIQRNEATMTKQFNLISQHLNTLSLDIMQQRVASENAFYLMSSTLAAESLIEHLKAIQQTLINTLTNMYQGHIDVHLLSPDQLQNELNKIARHLAHNLALPDTQDDIRDLYRLLRVHARVTRQYIIMEVKIPLLNDEAYELDRLISVPKHIDPHRIISTIPTTELIAFNIQKDTFIPLNQNDLHECQKVNDETYMCTFNHPEYDLKPYRSICDINLVKQNEVHNTYCHIQTATCADKWIKLHERNSWLYFCCDKCDVRIICPAGMTSVSLRQTGVITLSRGCVLKGDTFMLYTNNEHTDYLTISTPSVTFPNRSPLNQIISTAIMSNLTTPTHAQQFAKIKEDIRMIQKQSEIEPLTIHDVHHYIMIYIVICLGVIAIIATVGWRIRTKKGQEKERRSRPPIAEEGHSVREERADALYSAVKSDTKCSVELNEHELEEQFYSMLHYVDDTQAKVSDDQDALKLLENAPRSTLRRYWRTSDHAPSQNTPYQKVNTPKDPKDNVNNSKPDKTKPKEEKSASPLPSLLSLFQSPIPHNVRRTIEIIENDNDRNVVELESSDEDEVIEVALPPKPTIMIESSDEEELVVTQEPPAKSKQQAPPINNRDREVSASPVPSIVSSVSDEFIRGDCIALNISSRHPDNHSFDFSLHGSDLVVQSSPSKKKKRKKNKESATSIPIVAQLTPEKPNHSEECFATPKSKAKNKKQKNKQFAVTEKSVPSPDVYDSDSNQSIITRNKNKSPYTVTEKSLPSADVYESDSNQSEIVKDSDIRKPVKHAHNIDSSDSNTSLEKVEEPKSKRKDSTNNETMITVDLTGNCQSYEDIDIHENIVIGNVTGFTESEDYDDDPPSKDSTMFGSTKVPAILFEDLDFDNLKGKDKVCKNRRYSLTTLRQEMEKFYNESWGGEDFNHREIQKSMSRDKSLWAIDPKDRMPSMSKRKVTCNYCNRAGHRDDTCRLKPPVCYMCGTVGHIEPRCPSKICVNCGSPNHMYSTMCRNCCTWGRITCAECGQNGHPSSHCPDIWRRYHNTIDITTKLEDNRFTKKHYQMFCSGCSRRGHMVHTCRLSLPFSGLPINSPYVSLYRPVYAPIMDNIPQNMYNQRNRQQRKSFSQDSAISPVAPSRNERNKRQSKSPTVHESHVNKKRNISISETTEGQRNTKSPAPVTSTSQRKMSQGTEHATATENVSKEPEKIISVNTSESLVTGTEKALDFIPIGSANRDKMGQMIQDNEVSDTSDVVTSARIYVTSDIIEKLKTKEGEEWLNETMENNNVHVENADVRSFLSIKGKLGDQEAFQAALRDWTKVKSHKEQAKSDNEADVNAESEHDQSLTSNIPKNRNNVLRKLNKALDSLKGDLGEPKALFKELNYLENRHQQLLKQTVVNPQQLSHNRNHINEMLKKLNMVLLGQAGLADGSQHLSELYSLQEKLINFRQKNIPIDLRNEIGEHYHCIFTAIPRSDYGDLLNTYYSAKQSTLFKKKKKEKSFKLSPKKKNFNTIPSQPNRNTGKDIKGGGEIIESKSPHLRTPLVDKTMNKLVFYHRRLVNARPNDTQLKKMRVDLVRKLHSHIASLKKGNVTSKSLKKMKKIQDRAQTLLTNM